MIRILYILSKSILICGLALAVLLPAGHATAGGSQTVLYSFCSLNNCADGYDPLAGLIEDNSGNLYGTTQFGGGTSCVDGSANGCGTVFKLAPNGTETVLHPFCSQTDCTDGQFPVAGLIMDGAGNLYGTTQFGGGTGCVDGSASGCGTVFKLAADGTETVLHPFCSQTDCTDGQFPVAGLIMDGFGNLYGTTQFGGSTGCVNGSAHGCGIVFKLAPDGTETVLHSFTGGTDGQSPHAGLIEDRSGNVYGTTQFGGGTSCVNGSANGCGTVFKLAPDGTETVLHSFCSQTNCADGQFPVAGLSMDGAGNLYGTTSYGGANGDGTVFSINPTTGDESIVYSFCSKVIYGKCADGAGPVAGLIMDSAGNLYGTTWAGGAYRAGTVFKIAPNGTETVLQSFGANPGGGLIMDSAGHLYGTTYYGGKNNRGTVFELPTLITTTTLTCLPNPSYPSEPVSCSATVSSNAGVPSNGEPISFNEGRKVLGTGKLSGGSASFTTSSLPAGTTSITAVYGGDLSFVGSTSKVVRQVVKKLATTTTLRSSLNPSISGQAVTFIATVSSSAGAPPSGETVTLKKGYTVLGIGTLNGGSASFTTSSLPVGKSTITAFYTGDGTFAGSKSAAVNQVVSP
jgi:uncharacterized repeat protein (TIGR03803 family)